jgi:hypothetical protein
MRVLVLVSIGLVLAFGLMGCDKKIKEAAASEAEDVARAMEEVEKVEEVEEIEIIESRLLFAEEFVVDENRPLFEVRAEAEAMDDASLRTAAKSYRDVITSKRSELFDLSGKLDEFPFTDPLGQQTFTTEADIGELTESISALSERQRIYLDVLGNRGGDISGLGLD